MNLAQSSQQKKRISKFQTKPKPKYPIGEAKILEVANPIKIKLKTFFGNQGNQIFSLKFSNDQKMIATGTIDGDVKIYNVLEGKTLTVARSWSKTQNPTTSLRWRPKRGEIDPNYLVTTSAEGTVTWLKSTGQIIERVHLDSPIMCCDYSGTGENVIVGKQDFSIEVIHDNTKSVQRVYIGSTPDDENSNHSNRVFSIKSIPGNANQFISGGWDSNVRIWDIRQKESVRQIFGPHITGDSLDFQNGKILSGSYRNNDIVQLWDYGSGKLIETLDLQLQNNQAAYCYSSQFGQDLIGSALSVTNQILLHKPSEDNRMVGKIQLNDICYVVDFSKGGKAMAVGGAEGVVYVFGI